MHNALQNALQAAFLILGAAVAVGAAPAHLDVRTAPTAPWSCAPFGTGALATAVLGAKGNQTSACAAQPGASLCTVFPSTAACNAADLPPPGPGTAVVCGPPLSADCPLGPTAAASPFVCPAGVGTPVMLTPGDDAACLLNPDTGACMWDTSGCVAGARWAGKGSPVMACGAEHLAKFGDSGYEDPNHWCCKAYVALHRGNATSSYPRPYPFNCQPELGLFTEATAVAVCNTLPASSNLNVLNFHLNDDFVGTGVIDTILPGQCAEHTGDSDTGVDVSLIIYVQSAPGVDQYYWAALVQANNPYAGDPWMTVTTGGMVAANELDVPSFLEFVVTGGEVQNLACYLQGWGTTNNPTYTGYQYDAGPPPPVRTYNSTQYALTGIRNADSYGYKRFQLNTEWLSNSPPVFPISSMTNSLNQTLNCSTPPYFTTLVF